MADSLVIRNVTVIDGTGAAPTEDATIVIEGGRIVAAGPAIRAAVKRKSSTGRACGPSRA